MDNTLCPFDPMHIRCFDSLGLLFLLCLTTVWFVITAVFYYHFKMVLRGQSCAKENKV